MARYRVMSWQGIPAHVKADDTQGGSAKREMPSWFAQEIDRVAMRDGLVGTDAYMAGWSWSKPAEMPGTAEEVVDAVIERLAAEWGHPVGE
jgi:hypothetical protein